MSTGCSWFVDEMFVDRAIVFTAMKDLEKRAIYIEKILMELADLIDNRLSVIEADIDLLVASQRTLNTELQSLRKLISEIKNQSLNF